MELGKFADVARRHQTGVCAVAYGVTGDQALSRTSRRTRRSWRAAHRRGAIPPRLRWRSTPYPAPLSTTIACAARCRLRPASPQSHTRCRGAADPRR